MRTTRQNGGLKGLTLVTLMAAMALPLALTALPAHPYERSDWRWDSSRTRDRDWNRDRGWHRDSDRHRSRDRNRGRDWYRDRDRDGRWDRHSCKHCRKPGRVWGKGGRWGKKDGHRDHRPRRHHGRDDRLRW